MIKLEVPYIDQSIKYPTGCESVSAVMLLNYLGCPISVDEFIEKYLERQEFKVIEGEVWGPNPYKYFCGSPYDEESFGCYAPVICKALEKAIGDTIFNKFNKYTYQVIDETGAPIEKLLEDYIDKGMPVIFWACINMREPITGPCWKLNDCEETFTWISNEHCMLLVGYDEEGYYFNDPYENNGAIRYPKAVVADRHAAQHSQAVALARKNVGL